jgi:single stranded DNA-binding protein
VTLIGNAGRDPEIFKLGGSKESEQQQITNPEESAPNPNLSEQSMEREKRENIMEVARFVMATNQLYRNREGELVREAEWHNISVFNPKLCDLVSKFLKKGDKLFVEGRLRTRRFKDKDGMDRTITEIVVGREGIVQILSRKEIEPVTSETEQVQA